MEKFFLTIMLFLWGVGLQSIHAQTLFEDARGESAIDVPLGGIARLNTSARSIKLGYYFNRSDKDLVFGMDASGQSNNDFATLFRSDKLSPEANINFNIGLKNVTTSDAHPSAYDYLNLKIGVGQARYWMINPAADYDEQVHAESFTNMNAGLSYNYILHGHMIFGGYAGYRRTNNIPYLSRLSIKERTPLGSRGATQRTAESEYTAWQGHLETVNQFALYFDYVYLPDFLRNRLALSVYTRSRFNNIQSYTNSGLGLYLNRPGNPLKIVGGIVYELSDVFDARDNGNSLGDRGTLGLVVGYNF